MLDPMLCAPPPPCLPELMLPQLQKSSALAHPRSLSGIRYQEEDGLHTDPLTVKGWFELSTGVLGDTPLRPHST